MPVRGAFLRLASAATVAAAAMATAAAAHVKSAATPINTGSDQVQAEARKLADQPPVGPLQGHRVVEDRSGRKQAGDASVYSMRFQGRHTASGRRFDHRGNIAASKTLPIGTIAKVTDLETGRTAVVTVQDHGPYVDGRTIDLTKSTARQLGIEKKEGVAPVVVAPVIVPQQDGSSKPGAGALFGPATAK
jgi:rare lipoprotein A